MLLPPLLPGAPVSAGEVAHKAETDSHCYVFRADLRTIVFDRSLLRIEPTGDS